jgi:hypothetical protein
MPGRTSSSCRATGSARCAGWVTLPMINGHPRVTCSSLGSALSRHPAWGFSQNSGCGSAHGRGAPTGLAWWTGGSGQAHHVVARAGRVSGKSSLPGRPHAWRTFLARHWCFSQCLRENQSCCPAGWLGVRSLEIDSVPRKSIVFLRFEHLWENRHSRGWVCIRRSCHPKRRLSRVVMLGSVLPLAAWGVDLGRRLYPA